MLEAQQQIEAFRAAWQQNVPPRIVDYLHGLSGAEPDVVSRRRELLIELVKVDLEQRWRLAQSSAVDVARLAAGDAECLAPLLDDYVRQFPELGPLANLPAELVREEYRVRCTWGDWPSEESYRQRFPHLADELSDSIRSLSDDDTTPHQALLEKLRPALNRASSVIKSVNATDLFVEAEAAAASSDKPATPATAIATAPPTQIGRYRVESELGRGGFGSVYLALDEQLGRRVAIKVPRAELLNSPDEIGQFLREARLAAQLRHPALVEVYDVGRDEAIGCFIVMQYIDGSPLSERLKGQPVTPEQAADWIALVAEAVHCAHKMGLVHCDLKPANILIGRDNQPHVADFGLAVTEADQRELAGRITGSPAYMSPEQVRGQAHRFDGRTDIWGLGAILYELLTGRKPFGGSTLDQLFDEIRHREPKPPRQINDAIPARLEEICLRCLSKSVRDRYTNCLDLAADLRRAISGEASGSQRSTSAEIAETRAVRSNLPPQDTSFIGREQPRRELLAWLADPQVKLVTLMGPGGIGKTRLAWQLANDRLVETPGGCWFAELTECRSSADVAHAVARALDVPLSDKEPPEQAVAGVLEFRRPLLLVLDNFEQAVEAAQATVGAWHRAAPHVQFLVTSRAALGLAGERVYELEPLTTPPHEAVTPADVERFESLRLFCERAREAQPNFRPDARNLPAIAAICRALDGIPLAVELAAARIKILTAEEIARRLGQRFQLLQSARRDLTPRQQTLWGAIDWSLGLLRDYERLAFLQACAFRGGFDWDAAEAVIDLSAFPQAPLTLDVIQSLRDKSLLTRQETPFGSRFGMYQSIREYGERRWQTEADASQRAALQARLAAYFVSWAEGWNARIHTADGVEALARLRLELENLFAVQDDALPRGDRATAARAILAVSRTMFVRGPSDQRLPRLERSLAAFESDTEPLALALLIAASEAAQTAGDWDRATQYASRAVTAARSRPPPHDAMLARALRQQGEMHRQRGELAAALDEFVVAEQHCRALGEQHELARCLAARGFVVWQQGQADEAWRLFTEAEQIVRASGDLLDSVAIARHRGHVLAQKGDTFPALRCYAEAEAIARQLGDLRSLRLAIGDRGTVLATQGDFDGALECYLRAEGLARELGDKRGIAINVGNRGLLLADRGEPQAALECYEQAEALNRVLQSRYGIAINLGNRANALADLGRCAEALACLAEAESLNQKMGNKFLLGLNRGDRAAVFVQQGRLEDARTELQAALGLLDEVQSRHSLESFVFQAQLAAVEERLGNAAARELAAETLRLAAELQITDAHPKLKIREHLAALRRLAAKVDE